MWKAYIHMYTNYHNTIVTKVVLNNSINLTKHTHTKCIIRYFYTIDTTHTPHNNYVV